jgi:hypothetical protein
MSDSTLPAPSVLSPEEKIVKVHARCGQGFTSAQWKALPLVGYADQVKDGDQSCEMRNCPCDSTLGLQRDSVPCPFCGSLGWWVNEDGTTSCCKMVD